ncbi:MAG: hypothetical protein A2Y88_02845 [Chloroflexi bacterium RBG_13_48_10]|nr:MAG: hypothetical protein A2Y88_02845 [Chloroflexi bacterium RBG_13_48_10]
MPMPATRLMLKLCMIAPRSASAVLTFTLLETHPHLSIGMMRLMTGYIQEMQGCYSEMVTEWVE